jgi:hypothetical protein
MGWGYITAHILNFGWHHLDLSGELHAPASSPMEKSPLYRFINRLLGMEEADPVWTFW